MKNLSPLLLGLCAMLMASPQSVLADDTDATTQTAPADGSNTAQRMERMKEVFAQLDLTPEQKQQIRQIRLTVTDKVQRRQEVMAVLTADQKEKLRQILQQYRANGGDGAPTATVSGTHAGGATTGASGAGDGSDLAPGAN